MLDRENRQVMTARGKPRREIVWTTSEPSSSYLKARRLLADLHERRAGLRHDFRHRATAQVVKQAVTDGNDLIALEDLRVRNMSASARGSEAQPGRNVRQKSGLNRRILPGGLGGDPHDAGVQGRESRHPHREGKRRRNQPDLRGLWPEGRSNACTTAYTLLTGVQPAWAQQLMDYLASC